MLRSNELKVTENGVSQTGFTKQQPGVIAKNTDSQIRSKSTK